MYRQIEKAVGALAMSLAVLGAIALLAVTVLTVVSITGRALNPIGLKQIPGTIELVEFGIGFAVFSALPYAQFIRAHARVDVFKSRFGPRTNLWLDVIGEGFLAFFAGLVAWRLWLGMLDKASYGETSFILQIPVVWGYYAAMSAMAVACVVAAFSLLRASRTAIVFAPKARP